MNTPGIVWLKNGRFLRQTEDTVNIIPQLPKKVFNMRFDSDRHEIFLEEFMDEFTFDFKIYGMETQLIEHIMKTFNSTSTNLGILFNGTKGTGKTVTAKIIANQTNLPVILVNAPFPGLAEFISKIACPCVLFFDEFEKNFNKDEGDDVGLLSIMDGVFNSPYRRMFILTTNKLHVNDNLIGRPSRIRYRKSFGNLSPEVIMEYLEDNLIYKERIPEILSFIDTLSISTIDILKSIVEEINIHNISINKFKNFLNVEQAKYSYTVNYFSDDNNTMTKREFLENLNRIGQTDKSEDGDEITFDESDFDIGTTRISTPMAIDLLLAGESIGPFGDVIEPLDEHNIIVTENSYGNRYFISVRNLASRPSIYKGGLAY